MWTGVDEVEISFGKRILRLANSPHTDIVVQHILETFMVGPFFNLKADPVPQKNFQDKGKKKKSSKN
jgi:hypothetical protein